MVTRVSVFMTTPGLPPMVISQKENCLRLRLQPMHEAGRPADKSYGEIMVLFNNESDFRNRMPQSSNVNCLSRLHGCNTYAEFMPMAKELNLEAAAH